MKNSCILRQIIVICFCFFACHGLYSQSAPGVLQHPDYFQNPREYLSNLNLEKIPSNFLLDRILYDSSFLQVNGSNKVKVLAYTDWDILYSRLKYCNEDTVHWIGADSLKQISKLIYKAQEIHSISIIDYLTARIDSSALQSGKLVEATGKLLDYGAGFDSYKTDKLISATVFSDVIFGDVIVFEVNDLFYFSNQSDETIESIEIDFGNGEGYKQVQLNVPVVIDYTGDSEYILLTVKINKKKLNTNISTNDYAAFSVYRKSENTVVLPELQPQFKSGQIPIEEKKVSYLDRSRMFPTGKYVYKTICVPRFDIGRYGQRTRTSTDCFERYVWEPSVIEYNVLYSPQNINKTTFKRPLIVCDGFDPGNIRDYFRTDKAHSKNKRENDFRGLFELINGDPSPWYDKEPSPNLIDELRNLGYDIVIVNFLDGAGDIRSNAKFFKDFLMQVINSSEYRDSETEEAVVIGPSMGGLITRHMLATIEKEGKEHYVQTWISFDSPQKGANIPLGLQYSMDFLSRINTSGIYYVKDGLESAQQQFAKAGSILNTKAARQMLLYHYTVNNGKQTSDFDEFHKELDLLEYPKKSKNIALSNASGQPLYEISNDQVWIIDFGIEYLSNHTYTKAWANMNKVGSYTIMKGSRQGAWNDVEKSTDNQVGLDNASGGWHGALYSLNCDKGNKWRKSESDINFTKACFIPMISAFGIEVNRDNIYADYNNIMPADNQILVTPEEYLAGERSNFNSNTIFTPFDQIYKTSGLDYGINEEHVKISENTKIFLNEKVLMPNLEKLIVPYQRNKSTLSKNVDGEVAFRAAETVVIGGNENSCIFLEGSKSTISAGESVKLLPGFKASAGSVLNISIKEMPYMNVLKSNSTRNNVLMKTYKNPYLDDMLNFEEVLPDSAETEKSVIVVDVSPNPFSDFLTLTTAYPGLSKAEIIVTDYFGQMVYNKYYGLLFENTINLSHLNKGVYYLHIKSEGKNIQPLKIVKL